jgi:hypothetical protein
MDVDTEAGERCEHFGTVDCFVGDPTLLTRVPV